MRNWIFKLNSVLLILYRFEILHTVEISQQNYVLYNVLFWFEILHTVEISQQNYVLYNVLFCIYILKSFFVCFVKATQKGFHGNKSMFSLLDLL